MVYIRIYSTVNVTIFLITLHASTLMGHLRVYSVTHHLHLTWGYQPNNKVKIAFSLL
jgi:hypothetical protein